ncbi:MAG: S8 family serine peptidase, partial [Wenzhouxiangella sp.]
SQDQFQSYANAAPILDLLAPGGGGPFDDSGSSCRDDFVILGGIWSAYFQSVCPDAYLQDAGTSMAAPHVAGAQTLLSIRFPQASATGIRDWIKASGTPISFTQGTQNYTKPRLNLDQALIAPPSTASGPSNATVSPAMCFGINDVSWDSMPDATEYQVQGSLSSTFSSPWTLFRGTSTFITVHVQQPTYIRVRGWNMVSAGPWSVAGQAQYFSSCL